LSVVGCWVRRFQVIEAEPRGLLGLGEHGWLLEQGADTVEGASAGRMPPAEATDAMEARRQDVLQETAEELGGDEVGRLGVMFTELADTRPVALLGTGQEGEETQVVGEAIQDCVGRDFFYAWDVG
jgi:hypothetical protein